MGLLDDEYFKKKAMNLRKKRFRDRFKTIQIKKPQDQEKE